MEVTIVGEGELRIRLVDSKGRTMMDQKMVASGSPTVQAKALLPLELETADGQVPVAPVLAYQSNSRQAIRFDGQQPRRFTLTRCRLIGCSPRLSQRIAKGYAKALAPAELELPKLSKKDKRPPRTKRHGR